MRLRGGSLPQVADLAAADDLHAAVADVVGVAREREARAAARAARWIRFSSPPRPAARLQLERRCRLARAARRRRRPAPRPASARIGRARAAAAPAAHQASGSISPRLPSLRRKSTSPARSPRRGTRTRPSPRPSISSAASSSVIGLSGAAPAADHARAAPRLAARRRLGAGAAPAASARRRRALAGAALALRSGHLPHQLVDARSATESRGSSLTSTAARSSWRECTLTSAICRCLSAVRMTCARVIDGSSLRDLARASARPARRTSARDLGLPARVVDLHPSLSSGAARAPR